MKLPMDWQIDTNLRLVFRAGVAFRFHREGGAWIGECVTPGTLSAILGESQNAVALAAQWADEAGAAWRRAISIGHSRKHCKYNRHPHPWSKCPGREK